MKKLFAGSLVAMAAVMVIAGPAAAMVTVQFGSTATAAPRDRSTAIVPVSVNCDPGMTESSSGTLTVRMSQAQRSGTVHGSGSVDVICDNTSRDYLVPVTAPVGVFLPGAASVSGELAWEFTMCTDHPELGTECGAGTIRSFHDEQPISIIYRGM